MIPKQLWLSPSKNNGSEARTVETKINSIPTKSCRLAPTSSTAIENLSSLCIVEGFLTGLGDIIKSYVFHVKSGEAPGEGTGVRPPLRPKAIPSLEMFHP